MEPYESESDGYLRFAEEGAATKVSWGFEGEYAFPLNIMMLFMSMDAMIGPDFERGLALLKQICEKEAAAVLAYDVKEVDIPKRRYAAVQKTVAFDEMRGFYESSFAEIRTAMKKKRARMSGAPAGLYYNWDEQNKTTDMAAGMPSNRSVETGKVKTIELQSEKAFMVDHLGDYENLVNAHKALNFHLQKINLTLNPPIIEEYVTDPMTEPDTSKWVTKIYYMVD
jgi:effector-binding domain-containing protein